MHKLSFSRMPEEKKRNKPPIGMNAASRKNNKFGDIEDPDEESKEEAKDTLLDSDPLSKRRRTFKASNPI